MPTEGQADPTAGSGRRRDPRSHQAILDATLDLVEDVGYARLTIEGIAARAGVGKSTIYRWWSSKGALVIEALGEVLDPPPVPLTGDTRSELSGIVAQAMRLYSDETGARTIIAGLVADMHHDEDLRDALLDRFIRPRRAGNRVIVERAIARGDLPDGTDVELVIDRLVAPVSYRALVTWGEIGDDLPGALVDAVLAHPNVR